MPRATDAKARKCLSFNILFASSQNCCTFASTSRGARSEEEIMRHGLFVVLGASALFVNHALARPPAGTPEVTMTEFSTVTAPYELSGTTGALDASILYSHTTETGSRFNPGTGGNPLGSGVQQDVT